jgi:hypothetical protein
VADKKRGGQPASGNVYLLRGHTPSFTRIEDPELSDLPESWIDKYRNWASTHNDSPAKFHHLVGVSVLSTVMAPYAELKTNFDTIRPNIWAMMLAGTTRFRKSTSMAYGINMLNDLGIDYLMGTDGSPEGIFSELHDRDGKVSMFHRDEITGWIKNSARDYMSGILESFTRFYDCREDKRVLRSGTIAIKEPRLVILSGGILQEMEHLITTDHINSGFLPRFILVTAEGKPNRTTEIGPEEAEDRARAASREQILEELRTINAFWTPKPTTTTVQTALGSKTIVSQPSASKMTATQDAWTRMRLLKADALEIADKSANENLYTPLLDRLSNSVIKVAMLIAGARLSTVITYEDVVKAANYGNDWLISIMKFAEAVEASPDVSIWERKCDKIIRYMRSIRDNNKRGITRSEVMRKFRVSSKHIDDIESTLKQRGYIEIRREETKSSNGRPRVEYHLVNDPFASNSSLSSTFDAQEWGEEASQSEM